MFYQMLGAALVPGNPHANMYFTLYAYNSTEQGRSMTRDLKMGQYTKLPPRVTFTMSVQYSQETVLGNNQ